MGGGGGDCAAARRGWRVGRRIMEGGLVVARGTCSEG